MEYRYLGSTGLQVSALSYGSWVTFGEQLDTESAYKLMSTAYDGGVNFFDNAEAYGGGKAEIIMGEVIKRSGWKRSDLVVSTKIFWGGRGPNDRGLSRKHIIEGLDASLERLQMDYVDLIFCHRPDLYTPVEETVRAMSHIIDQGKAFYWGTSEWSAVQITEAYSIARREHLIPPSMEQPQYNMFHRERVEKEYAPLYEEIGLGTTTWSPLASGLLTGKYNQGIPDESRASLDGYQWLRERFEREETQNQVEKIKQMASIAEELGISMAQMAIAWCLKNANVSTVITGASKHEQILDNLKAIDSAEMLTDEIMDRIERILDNKPKPFTDFR